MNDSNPYQAPRAEIGRSVALADFSQALTDFTRSRAQVLGVAVTFCVSAVVGTASTLYSFWRLDISARSITMLYIATSLATSLLSAAAVFWLWQVLAGAETTTTGEQLATLLRRLSSFWLLTAILWCAPVVANLALSVGLYVFPMMLSAVVVGLPHDNALLGAAQRYRKMIRICLGVGGVIVLFEVASRLFMPFAATGAIALQAQVALYGGIIVQLALGAMAWRHVPALEAFLVQPNAATLASVAAAHRAFWKLALGIAVARLVYHLLSTVGMSVFF